MEENDAVRFSHTPFGSVIPEQFGLLTSLAVGMFEEVRIGLVGDAANRLTKAGASTTDGIGNQYGRNHEPALGSLAMISTTDPESMTPDERRLEVASILASSLLRRVRMARTGESPPRKKVSKRPRNRLELPAETRLSVAP